jgi:hypothetical protein
LSEVELDCQRQEKLRELKKLKGLKVFYLVILSEARDQDIFNCPGLQSWV